MKNSLLLLVGLAFFCSCSTNRPVNKIFSEYKKSNVQFAGTFPGWLVKSGLRIALKNSDPETYQTIQTVVPDIDKIRVLVTEDHRPTMAKKAISNSMMNANYDLYAMVKQKDANINIWAKEKKGKIRDIFVMVNADNSSVLMQIKGTINLDAIQKIDPNSKKPFKINKV